MPLQVKRTFPDYSECENVGTLGENTASVLYVDDVEAALCFGQTETLTSKGYFRPKNNNATRGITWRIWTQAILHAFFFLVYRKQNCLRQVEYDSLKMQEHLNFTVVERAVV